MATLLGHWLLPQLERMAKTSPDRIEEILGAMRHSCPELFAELHLMAVEHGELSRDEAAERLESNRAAVEMRLEDYRQAMECASQQSVIEFDRNGVARILEKHVTVWEIVREYRRTDSVDAMRGTFPGLSEGELRAALIYAGRNPNEIGSQIRAYEAVVERNKAAYPFAKK